MGLALHMEELHFHFMTSAVFLYATAMEKLLWQWMWISSKGKEGRRYINRAEARQINHQTHRTGFT